jgi:hypothetical protein
MLVKEAFILYMLLCGNNALEQKTVLASVGCCVHAGRSKTNVYVLAPRSFLN